MYHQAIWSFGCKSVLTCDDDWLSQVVENFLGIFLRTIGACQVVMQSSSSHPQERLLTFHTDQLFDPPARTTTICSLRWGSQYFYYWRSVLYYSDLDVCTTAEFSTTSRCVFTAEFSTTCDQYHRSLHFCHQMISRSDDASRKGCKILPLKQVSPDDQTYKAYSYFL